MENRKDGGPAYPVFDDLGAIKEGMSIRDHFAGLAMQGIVATDESTYPGPSAVDKEEYSRLVEEWRGKLRADTARQAYAMADAMLKAREQ